jgi:hypothetical protein
VEVGRADDGECLGTRGCIRRRRARAHDRPFHGGGVTRERRREKGERKIGESSDVAA